MAQDVKNDIKKAIQVNTIPLIAIMTAVTTVLTMFVKIPTPTRGYLNLSDTMIFFSSYAFGPWVGGIIGGLGPALSDLISGYPQWAIFTFIIDGLQAVLVGLLVREFNPAIVVIGPLLAGGDLAEHPPHPGHLRADDDARRFYFKAHPTHDHAPPTLLHAGVD